MANSQSNREENLTPDFLKQSNSTSSLEYRYSIHSLFFCLGLISFLENVVFFFQVGFGCKKID